MKFFKWIGKWAVNLFFCFIPGIPKKVALFVNICNWIILFGLIVIAMEMMPHYHCSWCPWLDNGAVNHG